MRTADLLLFGSLMVPPATVVAAATAVAQAQPSAATAVAPVPPPTATGVFPAGVQRGQQVTVVVNGKDLSDVRTVVVSGAGVEASVVPGGASNALQVRLTSRPDAEEGWRELRVVTGHGVTNALRLWVDRLPARSEREPNDLAAQAEVLTSLPTTLEGRCDRAEDVDRFTFTGKAGETWTFRLTTAAIRSPMDGSLTLRDREGHLLATAMDGYDRNPRLVYRLPRSGTFVLAVRDATFRGGPAYTYRLTLGKLPIIRRYTPVGGQRGTIARIRLQGDNLGTLSEIQVPLPQDPTVSRVRLFPEAPLGGAGPLDLFPSDLPEWCETEPNDRPEAPLVIPASHYAVTGHMDGRRDRDLYAIEATKGQPIELEISARRLGSRLDPILRILDRNGKEVARNDDAVLRDSRLLFTPPDSGRFVAEVTGIGGPGGDDYFYRLHVGPPKPPDFALRVGPDNPVVASGGTAVLTVTADRSGYAGPIALTIEGLPPGADASATVLPAGQSTALLTLSAPTGTPWAWSHFRVVGTAEIDGRTVRHSAVGQERYQPPLTNQPQQRRDRPTTLLAAVLGAPAAFTFSLPSQLKVSPGTNLEVPVKVSRSMGLKEPLVVTILGLRGDLKAEPLTLKPDQPEGKLTIKCGLKAVPGSYMVVVQGTAGLFTNAAAPVSLTVGSGPTPKP